MPTERKKKKEGGGEKKKKVPKCVAPTPKEAKPESVVDPHKDIDAHPFALGAHIVAEWSFDKSARVCEIVERAQTNPDDEDVAKQYSYYVHYLDFNRRMDEWLSSERILEPPSIGAKLAKEHASRNPQHKAADDENLSAVTPASGEDEGPRGRRRKRQEKEAPSQDDDANPTVVGDMEHDEHEGIDEASLREHEEVTKIKNVQTIELGLHIIECWYFSPFPKEYFPHGFVERLYFCEYSLRFFSHQEELHRYQARGVDPHPPGNEIYRNDGLAMFEVDGEVSREYCQNLCYLAKLFLDHKTLYYEVDPFLFYVMCEYDERGYHPTGYFSKEKYSDVGYNLACILTFPCYQRKGYGRFLISFSYELSKKELKVGSPEKPLSDLGAVSYRSYWSAEVLKALEDFKGPSLSIMEISKQTSILSDDVINALQYLGLLKYLYNNYVICIPPDVLAELRRRNPIKAPVVDPECLHWAPLIGQFAGKDKWSIKAKRPDDQGE